MASAEQLRENDFNLNIPRYVDSLAEDVEIDVRAVQEKIDRLDGELAEVRARMAHHLKELGI